MSKYFSLRLYKAGLQRSRTAGIVCCIILLAVGFTAPVSSLLNSHNTAGTILDLASLLYPAVLLTPFLVYTAFGFLNRRGDSDFYHALPASRTCLFFSFFGAVVTWIMAALVLSLTLAALLFLFLPGMTVTLPHILLVLAIYLAVILLVAAMTALAMSLTGTLTANVFVLLLFAISVRATLSICLSCISRQFEPIRFEGSTLQILEWEYSPFLMPLSVFDDQILPDLGVWLYYLLGSVILIALSCLAFCKRRSEMAGRSAPNRLAQHCFRCLTALPMVALTVYYRISYRLDSILFILIVLTLLVYYLYEVITTRQLANWKAVTAWLPVLAVCGLTVWGGTAAVAYSARNYAPDAEEIRSVSVKLREDNWIQPQYSSYESDDRAVLAFFARELADMKQTVSQFGNTAYRNGNCRYEVQITSTAGIRRTREITLQSGDPETLRRLLAGDSYTVGKDGKITPPTAYAKDLIAMPESHEITSVSLQIGADYLPSADGLWDCFLAEYNALLPRQKLEYRLQPKQENSPFPTLRVNGNITGHLNPFYLHLPLDAALFPKTCAQLLYTLNAQVTDEYADLRERLNQGANYRISGEIIWGNELREAGFSGKSFLKALQFLDGVSNAPQKQSVLVIFNCTARDLSTYLGEGSTRALPQYAYLLTPQEQEALRNILFAQKPPA